MKYKSLRTKILLIVMTLTITMLVVANTYNYLDRKELLYKVSIEKLLILTKAMNIFKKKQFNIYQGRVQTLQNNTTFLTAIKNNNLAELKIYVDQVSDNFVASTPSLEHLHIYNAQGIHLYHSDNPIVKKHKYLHYNAVLEEAKKTNNITAGYVVVHHESYYYSIVAPIKENNITIAYIEFGITADNLFKIASKSGRYKYALYLNDSKKKSQKRNIGQLVTSNSKLFKELNITQSFIYNNANYNHTIKHNNRYYLFNQYDIETSFQKNFAQVLLASNVTKYVIENKNKMLLNILLSLALLTFMYISIYMIITKLINKLIRDEEILSTQKTQMQIIIDNNHSFVTLFQKNKLTIANKSFLAFFQCKTLEDFNQHYKSLDKLFIQNKGTYTSQKIHDNLHWIHNIQALKTEKQVISFVQNGDNTHFFSVHINQVPNQEYHYVIIFNDITTAYIQSKKDNYMAHHDALTKVFNRQYFDEKFLADILNQNLYAHKSSLLMFDLDLFKNVNDTYGHQVGDDVLKQFAIIISNNIRDNDIFARWGGEEFVLLLVGTTIHDTLKIANNLRKQIEDAHFNQVGHITCSVGASKYIVGDNQESWLLRVDQALYKAKKNGRNRVVII